MVYTCEYEIKKDDFVAAGEASSQIKNKLKQIGVDAALIRKIAIASYEAEINMIIHSLGGQMKLDIEDDGRITIVCADVGPGIPDIGLAMQEGLSLIHI